MALLCVRDNGTELLLNTPNRKEILKEGPPQHTKCNVLGRGSYGTVFKGIFSGQQVAVKVVKNVREACVQSIKNESHVLDWDHPNIVQVLKIESTASFGIVIMERFAGRTLEQIIDHMQLPLKHRLLVTRDILAALAYCHKRHLLHLDVKPQNVLVSPRQTGSSYVCKLCDFGSSLCLAEQTETMNQAQGTVRYMSPEALRGDAVSAPADIYSLGITMWQLQERRIPYHWIQCNEVVAYQVVKQNLRPDRAAPPTGRSVGATRCDCQHRAMPKQLSPCSMEHVNKLLRQHKAEVKAEDNWFVDDLKVQSTTAPTKRKPFQNLNSNANRHMGNVVRNLQFDGARKAQPHVSQEVSLLYGMFESDGECNVAMEAAYADICKRCWHGDPASRPNVEAVRGRLNKILAKNRWV